MQPLDIAALKDTAPDDGLLGRRFTDDPETLYGLIGAVGRDIRGLPPPTRAERAEMAERILAYRNADGHFDDQGSTPGHAVQMAIRALNVLGEPVPENIGPLAPTDPEKLSAWLDKHDWQSTHKNLCGQTIPLLASGRVSPEWIDVFVGNISARLSPDRPLETWCAADAPPWKVISCIFHVLSAFDAGRLPYPKPDLLMQRLFDLRWEDVSDAVQRTECTDGDWCWLLLRFSEHLPQHAERALLAIRKVSARRVVAIREGKQDPQLIWTAVFQSAVREHYTGGYLRDNFNDPAMYRF